MQKEVKLQEIKNNIKKYYQYSQALHHFTNLVAQTTNAKDKIAYYICLDGFATRLSNYCLSLYEEVSTDNIEFYKGNSNRIYLRGCLESCLIINILSVRPHLTQNFMNNLTYDVVRINNVYNNSSNSRFELYKEFYNVTLEGKPQKRFGWLPRFKGKKALSMSDLLNYININDESKKHYYEMLIRSADNFSHPSFYIPRTVLSKNTEKNIQDIEILTNKNGILNECIQIISDFLKNFFELNSNIRISSMLDAILNDENQILNKQMTFLQVNDYILGVNNDITYLDAANFFKNRLDIDRKLKMRNNNYPIYISKISTNLNTLALSILKTSKSHFHKNIALLLLDAKFRIDDLFKAYYDFDLLSFYTQIRFLIEFVVTVNILINEDNERNKIYYIHQYIKGYQAKFTIKNFLSSQNVKINDEVNQAFAEETEKYQKSIDLIIDYYKKFHNRDIDRNNAVRLNAWALYLKGLDNDYILNLPSLLSFSVTGLMNGINEELEQYNIHINIIDYVLGLYEESCAYSHVTPYAWVNNIKLYKNRTSFKEQFLIMLMLLLELFKELEGRLAEDIETFDKMGIKNAFDDLYDNYQNLIIPFLNDFINQYVKNKH